MALHKVVHLTKDAVKTSLIPPKTIQNGRMPSHVSTQRRILVGIPQRLGVDVLHGDTTANMLCQPVFKPVTSCDQQKLTALQIANDVAKRTMDTFGSLGLVPSLCRIQSLHRSIEGCEGDTKFAMTLWNLLGHGGFETLDQLLRGNCQHHQTGVYASEHFEAFSIDANDTILEVLY